MVSASLSRPPVLRRSSSPRLDVLSQMVVPLRPVDGAAPCIPVLSAGATSASLFGPITHNSSACNDGSLCIFSGTANPSLSKEIATSLGVQLGKLEIKRFGDGEISVHVQESIVGRNVFLVQPTCPPASDNIMELLLMIDACKRASARNIIAVIPYLAYDRADKIQECGSTAANLLAKMIGEAGAHRVIVCDPHSKQSFFGIPIDRVYCQPVLLDYLAKKMTRFNEVVVVSPDVGGVARARAFAKGLDDAPLAFIEKRRHGHSATEVMKVIGSVKGKVAVLVDDMIDTAWTIVKGTEVLRHEGAIDVFVCATHPILSSPAIERLSAAGMLDEIIVTNTIPVPEKKHFPHLTILSVANLLGEAVWKVHQEI